MIMYCRQKAETVSISDRFAWHFIHYFIILQEKVCLLTDTLTNKPTICYA